MDTEDRARALEEWNKAGQALFGDDGPLAMSSTPDMARVGVDAVVAGIKRFVVTVGAHGIALCMPLDQPPAAHAIAAAMRLCNEAGLRGFSARGQTPATTRELLLMAAIEAGCDRALFLGHDSVIDRQGLWQLMATMERTEAAVVSALTRVPVAPPAPPNALSAFVGHEGAVRRMTTEDVTVSGAPFPVHHLDGIVAMLLDLDQIKRFASPRFSSKTEGMNVITEDEAFAKWLDMHSLEMVVDPKVSTARVGEQLYGWRWEPPKESE